MLKPYLDIFTTLLTVEKLNIRGVGAIALCWQDTLQIKGQSAVFIHLYKRLDCFSENVQPCNRKAPHRQIRSYKVCM